MKRGPGGRAPRSAGLGPGRTAAALLLGAGLTTALPAGAESLLELPVADPAAALGGQEGQPRTRRGAIVYPRPGLPSLVRPGGEVVARIRVRRAMTPPPGVQQPRILAPWTARLALRGAVVLAGADPERGLPLETIQIRPEDEGFVYRLRLGVPPWAPPGIYDLLVDGPGLRDVQRRAVRVLEPDEEDLELLVVAAGDALWREAEALWLLDPPAVLVPGGLLGAGRPLARFPLATFAAASVDESLAGLCLDLEPEVALAVARTGGCGLDGPAAADCLARALGGSQGLDRCGDALLSFARSAGPDLAVVGFGEVSLVTLPALSGPADARAEIRISTGRGAARRLVSRPPALELGPGPLALGWLAREARQGRDLVVLTALGPASWRPERAVAGPADGRRRIFVAGPGEGGAEVVSGAARIRLRRLEPRPRLGPEQVWGLEPGRYRLEGVEARETLSPAGLQVREPRTGAGLDLELASPPPGRLRIRVLVPGGPRGYRLASSGRPARIRSARPATGQPCSTGAVALELEVEPGGPGPVGLSLRPGGPAPVSSVLGPGGPVEVGRPVTLELAGVGPGAAGRSVVAWELGDGGWAAGPRVTHRYLQAGRFGACALSVGTDGAVAGPERLEVEVLAQGRVARHRLRGWALAAGLALLALLSAALPSLLARGNIVAARGR